MKLVIVTGLSGSGKSVALHALEDNGFYSIDNLPVRLVEPLADDLLAHPQPHREHVALGIDARHAATELAAIPPIVSYLREHGVEVHILFLETDEGVLLQRFSETRRRHPLANGDRGLSQAIAAERSLLTPFRQAADLVVDTTRTNLHQLRELIQTRLVGHNRSLSLAFQSFGFKYGAPRDADLLFDARCLPNPYWQSDLRSLTGKDEPVADFLRKDERTQRLQGQITDFVHSWLPCFEREGRSYLTVGVGCTGGRHRSVFLVEQLAGAFRTPTRQPLALHRELG